MSNRLQQLHAAGQSLWLDYIDRTMLFNGDLERRIRDDALTGMTSNPTIFEKALAEGSAYDAQLGAVAGELSAWEVFEAVETTDEGKRLWQTVDRPNVMIKVPGTESGAIAVRELLTAGVNVNITLLFSVEAHRRVIEAYLDALDA